MLSTLKKSLDISYSEAIDTSDGKIVNGVLYIHEQKKENLAPQMFKHACIRIKSLSGPMKHLSTLQRFIKPKSLWLYAKGRLRYKTSKIEFLIDSNKLEAHGGDIHKISINKCFKEPKNRNLKYWRRGQKTELWISDFALMYFRSERKQIGNIYQYENVVGYLLSVKLTQRFLFHANIIFEMRFYFFL